MSQRKNEDPTRPDVSGQGKTKTSIHQDHSGNTFDTKTFQDISGCNQAEELRKREERYRNIAEANVGIVWEMDSNLTVTRVSGRVYEISGYTPEEIIGRNPLFLVEPEDRESFSANINRMAHQQQQVKDVESWSRHKDGRRFRILTNCMAFFAHDGGLLGFRGTHIDITEIYWTRRCQEITLRLHEMINDSDDEISAFLCKACSDVTESPLAFFGMLEPDESAMIAHVWSPAAMAECRIADKPLRFPIEKAGLWAQPIRRREPIICNDYPSAPAKHGLPEGHVPITRYLGVPILHGDNVVAVAGVANSASEYEERHIQQLRMITSSIADVLLLRGKEQALRDKSRFLQSIIDTTSDLVSVTDLEGAFKFIGPSHSILGYDLASLIGRNVMELVHPDDYQSIAEDFADFLAKREDGRKVEYRYRRADGNYLWFETIGKFMHDDVGNPREILFSTRNITARKQAEGALRESELFTRLLLQSLPVPVFCKDNQGRYLGFNEAFESFFGQTEEELVGKTAFDIVPVEMARIYHEKDAELFDHPGTQVYEAQVKNARGEVRDVVFHKASLVDSFGAVTGLVGAILDITERKKAEEKLRESETKVRNKLKEILEPEGDLGMLSLSDVIDNEAMQSMMEEFYRLTQIGIALIDLSGKVLVAVGWQDICVQFHRCHPDTLKNCIESDLALSSGVPVGTFKIYRCKNNLWDMVTPIEVGGSHLGNLFLGQFFFEDEKPDVDLFRSQARRYEFDEAKYLAALDRVPRWSRESVDAVMTFYTKLASMISMLSYSKIKLSRALAENKRTEEHLRSGRELLNATERMSGVGGWEWNVVSQTMTWTDGTFRIHDFDPAAAPDVSAGYIERSLVCYSNDDRERVSDAFRRCVEEGEDYDLECGFISAAGRRLRVRTIGRAIRENGRTVKVIGNLQDVTELRKAEEALRESEERFRAANDASLDALLLLRSDRNEIGEIRDFVFLDLNRRLEEMLSMSRKRLLGKRLCEELPINREAGFFEKYRRVADTGVPLEEEFFLPETHVPAAWYYHQVVRVGDGVFICHRDITERKQAEEKLRESEERFKSLHNASFGGIAIHDKGIILECNQGLADMTGYSVAELTGGMDGLLLIAEKTRNDVLSKIQSDYEKPYEAIGLRKNGEEYPMRLEARNIPYKGKMVRTVEFRDITEQRKAEEALRASEEKHRRLFETMAQGVVYHAADGIIISANPAAERILGISFDQMQGKTSLDPRWQMIKEDGTEVPGTDHPSMIALRTGQTVGPVIRGVFHPDKNDHIWLTITAIPLFQPGETKPFQVYATFEDITERKHSEAEREKLQAQLTQAQKMESVGRLAGGVAHDFNNMLGVILGHTEMALEQVEPAQPLFDDLQEVRKAAERSADLTRQLLTFARKQTIAPRLIDLNETLENMLKMLRRLVGENIGLIWIPGKNLWPVKIDPSQLDQILANLCVNARDAIADVGKITIETAAVAFDEAWCALHAGFTPGQYVLLAVSDNGCGMDQETVKHLFEPFFTTKGQGKGTGLGLASVYGAVKQNNGFITVYSEPGQGTTFKIYLPRHQDLTPVQVDKVTAKPPARGKETILLVEDEPAILSMAIRMLEKLGYTVIAANTPGEALRLAREHSKPIDLLMTDVIMPEMNGRDLAKKLLFLYPDMKNLFMSGYTADVIAHHGVLDEGVPFIQKPFLLKDIGAKLREVIED